MDHRPELPDVLRDEAMRARVVFLVRLAVYGTVALLAIAVYFVRANRADPVEPTAPADAGVQMNGTTSHGTAMWVIKREGRITQVHVNWPELACTGRARWPAFDRTLGEWQPTFHRHGPHFTVADTHSLPPGADGWVTHVSAEVGGRLSRDGRTAEGWTSLTVRWLRDGHTGAVCESGQLDWSAHAEP